jgi:two-component system phosphate regulon sensor histidine kinase PhoR
MASHFALDDHKPAFVRVSIDEVIQRILPNLEGRAAEKEIELDCRPILAELYVLGERMLLIGVLQNLVRNAIEYTPQYGFVGIEVAEVDGWVRVIISDSGPGIPKNYVPWLFKPGFRITAAERGSWDGRGLGLAFVSRIIAMHGGRIAVESELGEGSRFVLDLPVAHELETPN